MTPLFRHSIRHPWWVILTAALITLAAAPGVLKLRIRTDGHALVPSDAPAIRLDDAIRDEFGIEDYIVVVIRSAHPDGLFNTATLRLVEELTDEIQKLDGIHPWNVISLATEKGDRVRPGTLIFRTFLEPMPQSTEELQRVRSDVAAVALYDGILVSRDGTATSILIGVPHQSGVDRTELYRVIRAIVDRQNGRPERIDVIGAPVAEALLGLHILQDLGVPSALLPHHTPRPTSGASAQAAKTTSAPVSAEKSDPSNGAEPDFDLHALRVLIGRHVGLVPVAVALMALVFFLSFRSVIGVALPLLEVGACLVFVFGWMGWTGVPVYLTIAVMPVILTAMGVADEIHVFDRYRTLRRLRPGDPHGQVLFDAMKEMSIPVVQTSLTTSVGFLSFALSPIAPVRAFGIFTAIGILFCMFWSLTAIPAMLTLIHAGRRRREPDRAAPIPDRELVEQIGWPDAANALVYRHPKATRHGRRFGWLGRRVLQIPVLVLLVGIAAVVAAPFGARRVVVQDSWIDGFAPQSEFYQATQYFNEQFLGTHMLIVCVDAGGGQPLAGTLSGKDLHHHGALLPADAVADPRSLEGYTLELERLHTLAENLPPGRRYVDRWRSRITHVEEEENRGHLRITTTPQDGSPAFALRLGPGEPVRYTIRPRRMTWPQTIRRIDQLESFLSRQRAEAVGGVLGPGAYLRTVNFLSIARRPDERRIPDKPERIELLWKRYADTRGPERLRQLVNEDYSRAVVSVFMKNANFVDTARLMRKIRDYERQGLTPHGMRLSFAGDVAVSQTLIQGIVTTQVKSLVASLVGVLLVSVLIGRSLVWGGFCVLPCALAVLINFAVMGWTGMPLGVATSMFSGMTLGIGVDFAIHFLARYRRSRALGLGVNAGIVEALGIAGPAIFIDALAVGLGFGVLTLSQVPANARLGYLVLLSIVNCFLATILLLPALLRVVYRRLETTWAE